MEIGKSPDRLDILSSEGGVKGVVIKHNQAEIIVMDPSSGFTGSIDNLIQSFTKDSSVLSRRNYSNETDAGGCKRITEVVSKGPAVAPEDSPIQVPYIINTHFFCEVKGRKVVTLLRNWERDKHQKQYQEIARAVSRSVRASN